MSSLYYPYSCMDNASQEVARVVTQKVASALSIISSGYVVMLIWNKWRKKKSSVDPYQRIMAGYALFDIEFSFFYWFLGTWMTPRETGWWGAVGNTTTCSIQGFFFYLGCGMCMYQVGLTLQMLLLVTFRWTPTQFEKRIEHRMHYMFVMTAVLLSTIPLFFDGYNPNCGTCLFGPLPYWCGHWIMGDGITECVRGKNTILSNLLICIFWITLSMVTLFCTVAMITIYRSVYNQEKKMAAYRFQGGDCTPSSHNHKESKRIRGAMLFYTGTFYVSWVAPLFLWYVPHSPPILHVIGDALFALLGFFNMLVFILPKCAKYQREHEGTGLLKAYLCVIFSNPIEMMRKTTTSVGNTTDLADDGIGFGSYNEHIESQLRGSVTMIGDTTVSREVARESLQ